MGKPVVPKEVAERGKTSAEAEAAQAAEMPKAAAGKTTDARPETAAPTVQPAPKAETAAPAPAPKAEAPAQPAAVKPAPKAETSSAPRENREARPQQMCIRDRVTFLGMLLIGIITSVMSTNMKEQQRQLAEQEKALMEAQKEKMRVNLLRAVSHDLRTPLTGIIGSSSFYLEMGDKLSEAEKRELVERCV